MTFDNFLDDFEVEQLLYGASYGEGFQRSTDQSTIISGSGEMVKVTSKTRTRVQMLGVELSARIFQV